MAESLLAGHQYRTDGTIRLHVVPGGFGTGPLSGSPTRLVVQGGELLVHDPTGVRTMALNGRSLGEIAALAGISCGPPEGVYPSSTPSSDDVVVDLEPTHVNLVQDAFAVGDAALRALAGVWKDPVGDPVLWPEHFDVSCSVPGATVGVSPGDEYVDGPYAYVVPDVPQSGEFWNAPFGASWPFEVGTGPAAVVRFFVDGLARATSDPAET